MLVERVYNPATGASCIPMQEGQVCPFFLFFFEEVVQEERMDKGSLKLLRGRLAMRGPKEADRTMPVHLHKVLRLAMSCPAVRRAPDRAISIQDTPLCVGTQIYRRISRL